MEDANIIFNKMRGLRNIVQNLIDERVGNNHEILNFNQERIEEFYPKYKIIVETLKENYPGIYSDYKTKLLPEYSEGGTIDRSFILSIMRDINYLIELFPKNNEHLILDQSQKRRIFISHGSNLLWLKVQRFIEKKLKIETLELEQEVNLGRTILQKLEEESNKCSYAVVVMTGDDKVIGDEVRARQNVVHEIGFFQGKYGFDRVSLLYQKGVEIPTNIQGLVYIQFENEVDITFTKMEQEIKAIFQIN